MRDYINVEALDTNLDNIKLYFHRFCQIMNINETNRVIERKLFTSAMMRIYCPGVYKQHKGCLVYPIGLGKEIRTQIGDLKNKNGYKLLRQAIMDEQFYDDYRNQVNAIVKQLFPIGEKEDQPC